VGLDPSNVFITKKGQARIGGFGRADAGSRGEYKTPERIAGRPEDQRTDIFALGVLLYEMLTGLSPFRRVTGFDTEEAITSEDPPLVSENTSTVTPAFDGVIRRCLHKKPVDRFQSARNVESALQALVTVTDGDKKSKGLPRPSPRILALVPAVLGVVLAFTLLHMGYQALLEQGGSGGDSPAKIAVVPFETRGERQDTETAVRMTEGITRRLADVEGLVLVDPSRSELATLVESARGGTEQRSADYVLRGSVEWVDAEEGVTLVRVQSELFGRDLSAALWTKSFDCVPGDIAALPADIAEHVVVEIRQLGEPATD
jgi:TolB-like protein